MQTTSGTPASADSRIASAANGGGTKISATLMVSAVSIFTVTARAEQMPRI